MQTFVINVTNLPLEGANYRNVRTVANQNWYFAPSQALSLGIIDEIVENNNTIRAHHCHNTIHRYAEEDDVACTRQGARRRQGRGARG